MLHVRTSRTLAVLALGCALAACGDDTGNGGSGTTGTTVANGSSSSGSKASTSGAGSTTAASTTNAASSSSGANACATDICAMYGAAVPMVVSQIVDEAAASPEFMDDFAPLVAEGAPAVMAFKTSLTNFISDAYGCSTDTYTGPSMQAAHAGMGITQMEYDQFVALIAGVLADNGVPASDIMNCFAPPLVDPAFSSTIVGQ